MQIAPLAIGYFMKEQETTRHQLQLDHLTTAARNSQNQATPNQTQPV
jgi:hypothetical protein